jgi:tRNA A-37 threonylcarbamoyl transferase component Bud32
VNPLVDDRYELGDFLASGGMADVYAARDRTLDRPVAVKRLKANLDDPPARARFEREARALAGFSHPNAVAVFDAGNDADGPYIVMELLAGPTLSEHLRVHGRLSFAEASGIADQILAALGAAHARGIVHRDVKPANVLFAADGTVKLADFGIAKVMADATADVTMTGELVGTPKYVAPEQTIGGRATPQSDLYAVGVLLYEMVAGVAPFAGDTPAATLAAHQRAPVPDLRVVRPDAPAGFVAVVTRALAKDPDERFADAAEMRAALRGEATVGSAAPTVPMGQTVPVDETLVLAPVRSPARRRWPWVAAAALVAGALVAALVALAGSGSGPGATVVPTVPATVPATTPATTVPPRTVPPTTVPSTTVPRTTVPATPQTLAQLAALLAAHPGGYGTRTEDLRRALAPYLTGATATAKDTARLVKQIGDWVRTGGLDATIGATAIRLLDAVPTTDAPPGKAKQER